MLSYEICNRMAGHTCSSVLVPARIELLNNGNWGGHAASLVKLGETDLVPKFSYRHPLIDDCGGNTLLLTGVEYSYLKGQWPISRGMHSKSTINVFRGCFKNIVRVRAQPSKRGDRNPCDKIDLTARPNSSSERRASIFLNPLQCLR